MNNCIISISNLNVDFYDKPVLRDVNLNVSEGELLAIIGESGSGKSILLKSILGLVTTASGEIVINHKFKSINNFGVLFQNSALFDSLTVCENIAFNFSHRLRMNKVDAKKLVIDTLLILGLDESILYKYPMELSGGMKKRVAIARAIVTKPKILILDEPSSELDPITTRMINDIIVKFNRELKTTTIFVTHDINSVLKMATKIVVLYQGNLILHGSVEDIVDNEYVKKLLQTTS